jgi:hypothetical protein
MPTSVREFAQERALPYSTALRLARELRADLDAIKPGIGKQMELDQITVNDYRRFLYNHSVTVQLLLKGFTSDVTSLADFAEQQQVSLVTVRRRIAPYINELGRHDIWFNQNQFILNIAEPATQSILYSFFKTTEISLPELMTKSELQTLDVIAAFYEQSDFLVHGRAIDADRRIIIAIWLVRLRKMFPKRRAQDAGRRERDLVHLHQNADAIFNAVMDNHLNNGTVSELQHAIQELDYLIGFSPYQVQYLSATGIKCFMRRLGTTMPKLPATLRMPIRDKDELAAKVHRVYYRVLAVAEFMRIFGSTPFVDGGFVDLSNYQPVAPALSESVAALLPTDLTRNLPQKDVHGLINYMTKHIGLILMTGWRTPVYMTSEFTPIEHDIMSNWFWGLLDLLDARTINADTPSGSVIIYQHHSPELDALLDSGRLVGMQWITELSAAVNAGRLAKLLRMHQQSIFSI